jgi:hypothetical protein
MNTDPSALLWMDPADLASRLGPSMPPRALPTMPSPGLEDVFRGEPADQNLDAIAAKYGVRAAPVSDLYSTRGADQPAVIPASNTSGLVSSQWPESLTPNLSRREHFELTLDRVLRKLLTAAVVVFVAVVLYKLVMMSAPGVIAWMHQLQKDPANPTQTAHNLKTVMGG